MPGLFSYTRVTNLEMRTATKGKKQLCYPYDGGNRICRCCRCGHLLCTDTSHNSSKGVTSFTPRSTCMYHHIRNRYTTKSYDLNQKWNQSDPDLYPETQQNFLATGLIPNCKSDLYQFAALYQFSKNSPKTCCSYRSDTDMCVLI